MKVQNTTSLYNCPKFKGAPQNAVSKVAKTFADMGEMGEGVSIACDFLGKALVVPFVIMMASDEPKDKKEFSALKNPVAATIQLGLEAPVLFFGSKLIGKYANKGFFDKNPDDSEKVFAQNPDMILNLIQTRRSVRKYKQENVSPETIQKLKDMLKWVPTGCNYHRLHFSFIDDINVMNKFRNHVNEKIIH